jgi:hypothetical protein
VLRLGVGLGLGDGLLVLLGLGEGLLVGSGVLLLGLGLLMAGLVLVLVLVLVLADGLWLWLGLGLPEVVGSGVRLALLAGVAELLVGGAEMARSDTDAASAIAVSGRPFSAEAALAAAGRFAHGFLTARVRVACGLASSTLTSPYESTAVPASALNLADPACRFLTVSASPWSMS